LALAGCQREHERPLQRLRRHGHDAAMCCSVQIFSERSAWYSRWTRSGGREGVRPRPLAQDSSRIRTVDSPPVVGCAPCCRAVRESPALPAHHRARQAACRRMQFRCVEVSNIVVLGLRPEPQEVLARLVSGDDRMKLRAVGLAPRCVRRHVAGEKLAIVKLAGGKRATYWYVWR
jgi:hypothetical protein